MSYNLPKLSIAERSRDRIEPGKIDLDALRRFFQKKLDVLSALKPIPPNISIPPATLEKGIAVEMEHTTYREIATVIAIHHLSEKLDYYDRLDAVEDDQIWFAIAPTVRRMRKAI